MSRGACAFKSRPTEQRRWVWNVSRKLIKAIGERYLIEMLLMGSTEGIHKLEFDHAGRMGISVIST